jgi:hypothetical protein
MRFKTRTATAVAIAAAAIGVTACGGSSHPKSVNQANASSSAVTDASVKSDVEGLFSDNGMDWQVSTCVHQNGNAYVCSAWKGSDTRTLTVTDDGSSVYEQGISKGE